MDNVSPAIDKAAVRADPVLAATENVTLPPPWPLAPEVIATHGADFVAFHAQPALAVTTAVRVPPAAGTETVVG